MGYSKYSQNKLLQCFVSYIAVSLTIEVSVVEFFLLCRGHLVMFVQNPLALVLEGLDTIFDISAKDDLFPGKGGPCLIAARCNKSRSQTLPLPVTKQRGIRFNVTWIWEGVNRL